MVILKYFMLVMILTLFLFGNSIEVRVNSTRISEGEKLDVKLIAEGKGIIFPSINNIAGFILEDKRTSQKSQMKIVDGAITQKSETILAFSLYPDKNLTIPSFKVKIDGKEYLTKPVEIEVIKGNEKGGLTKNFKIKTSVDKKSAFVGEPIIFKVDVIEPNGGGTAISQLNYLAPEFKKFFVKQIGREKIIRKDKITIHELRYLLIPQSSGEILIPPAGLKVGVEDMNAPADPFGLFGTPIKWYSMRSKSISISVKSPPKDIDLIGDFKISATLDKTNTKPNQPVNYTLKIEGLGSLEDIEDPVFKIPNVTTYSDNPVVKSKLVGDKLMSVYTKKYVFISDRSFTIPEVKFKEFDYTKGITKEIRSRSFSIAVDGSPALPTPTNIGATTSPQNVGRRAFDNNSSILEDSVYYAKKEYEEKEAMLPFYTLTAFLAGMMAMLALMKLFKKSNIFRNFMKRDKRVLRNYTTKEALNILYPYTSDSKEVEDMVKKLYKVLKGKRAMHIIDKNKLHRMVQKYEDNQTIDKIR